MNRFPYTETRPNPYEWVRRTSEAAPASPQPIPTQMVVDRVRERTQHWVAHPDDHQQDAAALAQLISSDQEPAQRASLRDTALSMGDQERALILKHLIKSAKDPDERARLRDTAMAMEPEEKARNLKRLLKYAEDPTELSVLRADLFTTAVTLRPQLAARYLEIVAEQAIDTPERVALFKAAIALPRNERHYPLQALALGVEDLQELRKLHRAAQFLPDGKGAQTLFRLVDESEDVYNPDDVGVTSYKVPMDPTERQALRLDTRTAALDLALDGDYEGSHILQELLPYAEDKDEARGFYNALGLEYWRAEGGGYPPARGLPD